MIRSAEFDALVHEIREKINQALEASFKCRKMVGENDYYLRQLDVQLGAALYALSRANEFSSPLPRPLAECRMLRENVIYLQKFTRLGAADQPGEKQ